MSVGTQEMSFCFSRLKFMDAGCAAILSSSRCLKSIVGAVTSTPDSGDIKQDFRPACRGSVYVTRCRQTRDGTDVDDGAERDGYGLKCSKTLTCEGLGRTGPPFTLHRENALQPETRLCYGSYGQDTDSDLYDRAKTAGREFTVDLLL